MTGLFGDGTLAGCPGNTNLMGFCLGCSSKLERVPQGLRPVTMAAGIRTGAASVKWTIGDGLPVRLDGSPACQWWDDARLRQQTVGR